MNRNRYALIIALAMVCGMIGGCSLLKSSPVYDFDSVDVKPMLVEPVAAPKYPEIATRSDIEGMIRIKMLIGKNGAVEKVEFLKGPGVFYATSVKATMHWKFKPAMKDGKPVRTWLEQSIRFRLKPD